jgi:RNA polymerase sigma-70 factor (ECF subfamily)
VLIDEGARAEVDATDIVARFEQVFRAEVHRVHSYARARLGEAEADDVVSEVFHAAALAMRDGNEAALNPAWLMTVTKNKVVDRWRSAQRRKARDMVLRQREPGVKQFDDWTDPGNREQVIRTLDQLSARHRMLLVLHYVDGLSVPEIADQLDQSVASLESALARARRAFRAEFARQDHAS